MAHDASGTGVKWLMRVASIASARSAPMPRRWRMVRGMGKLRGGCRHSKRKGPCGGPARRAPAVRRARASTGIIAAMTTDGPAREVDLIIVGAGLVGASLACALDGSGLRVALVEASLPSAAPPG